MKPLRNDLMDYPAPEALLFDLDGTLYRGNERIPGADRLITELQQMGIPCWFVTNNSTRTPIEVARHLQEMNIAADEQKIVTSALATAYYVREHYPGADIFVIGENGLYEALRDAGLQLIQEETTDRNAALVIQGLDRKLTYDRLKIALNFLLNGAVFVQTNPDLLLPINGGFLPGAGSIGAALQASSGIKPIVIGKPSNIIMDYTLKLAGTTSDHAWVIGDNPYTDLTAGRNAGCPSILVLTGICTEDNWQEHCNAAGVTPQAVCQGPQELAALLASLNIR
jgi:4-nitrophenyl phosphatase